MQNSDKNPGCLIFTVVGIILLAALTISSFLLELLFTPVGLVILVILAIVGIFSWATVGATIGAIILTPIILFIVFGVLPRIFGGRSNNDDWRE